MMSNTICKIYSDYKKENLALRKNALKDIIAGKGWNTEYLDIYQDLNYINMTFLVITLWEVFCNQCSLKMVIFIINLL
jgi:hypothetical protein